MMKHLMLAIVGLTLVSSPVLAAKHCVDKNKNEVSVPAGRGKTRAAQCRAAGGKWVKIKKTSTTTRIK